MERPRPVPGPPAGPGHLAVAEPLIVELASEPVTEGYLDIIDLSDGRRVVTSIEVLSPSNKRPGEGRRQFLRKQKKLRAGRVNTVEIDLLRAGRRVLALPANRIPPRGRTPYLTCVWRGRRPDVAELYPIPLRARLPVIPIPLRPTDADVPLDLQPLVDQTYINGGYDDIDYRAEPDPPLDPDDAAWADALLRGRGLR